MQSTHFSLKIIRAYQAACTKSPFRDLFIARLQMCKTELSGLSVAKLMGEIPLVKKL
jgi:hypothetical protein